MEDRFSDLAGGTAVLEQPKDRFADLAGETPAPDRFADLATESPAVTSEVTPDVFKNITPLQINQPAIADPSGAPTGISQPVQTSYIQPENIDMEGLKQGAIPFKPTPPRTIGSHIKGAGEELMAGSSGAYGQVTKELADVADMMAEVSNKYLGTNFDKSSFFRDMSNELLKGANYWKAKAAKEGTNAAEQLLGKVLGSTPAGVGEFMLGTIPAAVIGGSEKYKEGGSTLDIAKAAAWAGIKRSALGKIFKAIEYLPTKATRAGAGAVTLGGTALLEGAPLPEALTQAAVGGVMSLGGGREARPIEKEVTKLNPIPIYEGLKKAGMSPDMAEAKALEIIERKPNAILQEAQTVQVKPTDTGAVTQGMEAAATAIEKPLTYKEDIARIDKELSQEQAKLKTELPVRVRKAVSKLESVNAIENLQINPVTKKWSVNIKPEWGIENGIWIDENHYRSSRELGFIDKTTKLEGYAQRIEPSMQPEAKAPAAEAKQAKPAEGVKTSYTSVPEEWKQSKKLYDWGQKGLRAESNQAFPRAIGSKKTRKSFIWQGEFDKVPVRLPRETMNVLRAKTDEIWKVQTRGKGEDYYIVPKKVLADVKAELGQDAFAQNPKPIRSPKQTLNDFYNRVERGRGLTLRDIGDGLEKIMAEKGLTETDLNDKFRGYLNEYRKEQLEAANIRRPVSEGMEQKVSDADQKFLDEERRAIQEEQTAGEIGDFLDGLIEEESRQTDLLGRPETKGGASGKQQEFLDKENFKTLQERERINAEKDLEGQGKIKEGLNAPLKELGGMPRKPPGLTKDEMEHLGRREQEALKAGQAKGLNIGYKLGERAAYDRANSVIFKLKTLKTVEAEHRAESKELVDSFVPKEHRYRYTNRILNTKSPKMIKALMGQVEKYVAKADKRLAVRELRTFISGVRSEYGKGETPFGKLPENLRSKFKGFLDRYDLSKLSEDKAETLTSRDEYIQGVAKNVAEELERLEFDSAADQDVANVMLMGNSRIQELRRLSKVHVTEMTTDDIRGIQQNFERMLREVELKNTIRERVKIEKMRDATRKAVKQVAPSKTVGKIVEFTPGLRWLVKNGAANLKSLADFASGKDRDALTDIVWNNPIEGNRQRAEVNKKLSDAFKAKMESIGYTEKDFQENLDLVDIVYGGKKMRVPLSIPITIYAHTMAEGNLERLLKSAGDTIRFPNRNKFTGLFVGTTEYRTSKPATMDELKKIVDGVPEKHKKAVDAAMEFNWENVAPEVNKYFKENKGYEVATKKRYWSSPTERDAPIGGEVPKLSSPPEQKGRYQPRTGGNVRRAIVPWFIEVASNIQDTAALSMAEPLRAFRATLANREFRETLKSNGHGRILDEFDTLLKRIQGYSTDQSIIERNMSKFLGNYGKSRLAIRPSGFIVQTTSPTASFSVIEPKYFVNTDVVKPALIEKLKAKSGLAWERWEKGHFNFILGELSARHWFESTVYNKTPWTDKMTAPYTYGDEVANGKLYLATERQIEAQTGHKVGTPENEKVAIEYWEKEVLPTQGMHDMLFRSDLTSHPNPVLRGSMMFMTTMSSFHNTIMQSMSDYSKGRISATTAGKNIGGVVTSTAMSTIIRKMVKVGLFGAAIALLGNRNEDKPEIIQNKLLDEAKNAPKDIIFDLVGMAPFGNTLTSAAQVAVNRIERGYIPMDYSRIRTGNIFADVTLDTTQAVVDYSLAVTEYLNRDKKEGVYQSGPRAGQQKWKYSLASATDNLVDVITGAGGLPYSGPKGDFYYAAKSAEGYEGAYNLSKDITDNLRKKVISGKSSSAETNEFVKNKQIQSLITNYRKAKDPEIKQVLKKELDKTLATTF